MHTPGHSGPDRLAIATVCGTAARVVYWPDRAAAIAELHALTTDPHLLAHGVPRDGREDARLAILALLLAAGATQEHVAQCARDYAAYRAGVRRGVDGLAQPKSVG